MGGHTNMDEIVAYISELKNKYDTVGATSVFTGQLLSGTVAIYNVTTQAMVCGEQVTKMETFMLNQVQGPPSLGTYINVQTNGYTWKISSYTYTYSDKKAPP